MTICKIETFRVLPRWLFVRLESDSGIVGWGEASLEGHAEAVEGAIQSLRERFLGSDPCRIEDLWQVGYRGGFYRGGPVLTSALSGVEQALWDLKGRYLGIPAWEMLGGQVRDRVGAYSWIGGDRPAGLSVLKEEAAARKAQGFTAVKMNATAEWDFLESPTRIQDVLDRVEVVKSTGMDVALDFHGRIHWAMAKRLVYALRDYGLLFIEEPVLSEHVSEVARIAMASDGTPIALGERVYTRWGFRPILEAGAAQIIQPDLSHVGGLFEARKVAAMAETYDVAVAPHCPLGPLALASCLQLAACTPNVVLQEVSLGIHYNEGAELFDYVKDRTVFDVRDGFLPIPQGAGLGVEIDEERVRDVDREAHHWRNPVWRGPTGSVVEW